MEYAKITFISFLICCVDYIVTILVASPCGMLNKVLSSIYQSR